MESVCVRYTELPATSKLFTDFLYHPDRVRRFYGAATPESSAREAAAAITAERREAMVAALAPDNPGSPNLERLRDPGTVAVVTGQQVGLFAGPAYTVFKALTAAKLAHQLTESGIPAVPVFWLATEDHDFAEVNHAWLFDASLEPQKVEMSRLTSGQPVGGVTLENPPVEALAEALKGFPFADEVVALVREAYVPGATMGQAFSHLMKRVLRRFDLVHVDPMQPAFRALAAPAVRATLDAAPELSAALLERNSELAAAGYHAQVHVEPTTSLLFLLEGGKRLAMRRNGEEYQIGGRRLSTAELKERAHELSPNALLRPVIQDSVLPTVAYVGGPAELAYLAQSQVIYSRILGRMPVALHRAGFTLLDGRSHKLMARYGLTLNDFFHGEEPLKERVASRLIPPALGKSVEGAGQATEAALERLAQDLAGFDAGLAKALETSRRKIAWQVSKMERKIGREMLARDARAARDAAALFHLVYPHRHLQERLYSILPFLAKHGEGLVDELYQRVNLACPDHQVIVSA